MSINKDEIRRVVEKVWMRLGIALRADRRGPVQLAPFMQTYNLLHIALPRLSNAVVYDYLRSQGIPPADIGDEDMDLAGFLFITPSVGLVFVNSADPVPRQRFSAAHELGHYLLHRGKMRGVALADTPKNFTLTEKQSNVHELEANRFAVELLMPETICRLRANEFKRAYGVCPQSPLAHNLAAGFLVSREAMLYRLQELEVGDA